MAETSTAALAAVYARACEQVRVMSSPAPSQETQLALYGLFKQAQSGDAPADGKGKPALWDLRGRAKWDAWAERSGLSSEDAMREYIVVADTLLPENWREVANADMEKGNGSGGDDGDGEGGKEDARGGGGGNDGMTPAVSTLAGAQFGDCASTPYAEGGVEAIFAAVDGWDQGQEGGEEEAAERLREAMRAAGGEEAVLRKDDTGKTVLHLAVDRGHARAVDILLSEGKAEVDAVDGDGQTPLMYAVMCEHEAIAATLLEAGADPTLEDTDGESALAMAEEGLGEENALVAAMRRTRDGGSTV